MPGHAYPGFAWPTLVQERQDSDTFGDVSVFGVCPRMSCRYAAARPAVLPCAVGDVLHPNVVRISPAVEPCARRDAAPPDAT